MSYHVHASHHGVVTPLLVVFAKPQTQLSKIFEQIV